jgi:hypothetical protein
MALLVSIRRNSSCPKNVTDFVFPRCCKIFPQSVWLTDISRCHSSNIATSLSSNTSKQDEESPTSGFPSSNYNKLPTSATQQSGPPRVIEFKSLERKKQKIKELDDSLNSSSSTHITVAAHPAHHYISGGMPCDPTPPPFRLAEYGEGSLYSLILLRHGESEWNSQNRYTGW